MLSSRVRRQLQMWIIGRFHVIWRFMSFGVSCHLAFHVIWRFMSFGVSCHLAFHVILAIIVIIVTKVLNGINAKVVIEDRCVFKKWLPPLGGTATRAPSELKTKFLPHCRASLLYPTSAAAERTSGRAGRIPHR